MTMSVRTGLLVMHDVQQPGSSEANKTSSGGELVESLRADFEALAAIMDPYQSHGDLLDCVARAKAAIKQGIELSDRLTAHQR
jgi:hypothetical protein